MRVLACLRKTLIESAREWKLTSVALLFAPAFVFMMYGYYAAAPPAYRLVVIDADAAPGLPAVESRALVDAWRDARDSGGRAVFTLIPGAGLGDARARLARRDAELVAMLPAGFSEAVRKFRETAGSPAPPLRYHADPQNPRSLQALAMADQVAFVEMSARTRRALPLDVTVQPLVEQRARNDFDLMVPSLLALAIVMVLFTAATALVREVDRGTMVRLRLSRLSTPELITAMATSQLVVGTVSLALAYAAALACGYRGGGDLVALFVVGAAGSLAVAAVAVLVSAFLRSMFELLTVGVFPFFVLLFFSECMFPLPRITLFAIAGHAVYANDLLPPTLCVRAFNRILGAGASLHDVGFELAGTLLLSAAVFVVGGVLFHRRHAST